MSDSNFDALRQRALDGDREAQFAVGRAHAAREEWARARRYLREAADAGHAGALFGIGMPPEIAEALSLLQRAEQTGSGEAAYQLSLMAWCDLHVAFEPQRMDERLREAARRDFVPALRALGLIYARGAAAAPAIDAIAEACWQRAATLGDATSAYLLGRRWVEASDAERRSRGRSLLAQAARLGSARAQLALGDATVASAGTAAPADPLPPLPSIDLLSVSTIAKTPRHADPLIETFEDVYAAEECEYIIALGEGLLQKSVTLRPDVPGEVKSDIRTSSDHEFYTFQEDFALRWLQWRMLNLLQVPLHQAEQLVLLRYVPGEEYKPHRDYLPPSARGMGTHPDLPGQRVHTAFCYLSDVEAGGETDFPLLNVRISPQRGRVVHFLNVLADGEPDARTLHAGMPVIAGTKWLATLWTRQRRTRSF
jgi:prolyl 4-hydroxylase